MSTLRITQTGDRVTLELVGESTPRPEASFSFKLAEQEREELRWYLEEYLDYPFEPNPKIAARVEGQMEAIGVRLFDAVFRTKDARKLWDQISDRLGEVRVEVASNAPATDDAPWELMFDSQTHTYLALHAQAFVRSHLTPARNPRLPDKEKEPGPLRVLLAICRPGGGDDVSFRSVAIRLIRGLGEEARQEFQLDVLRPPTFQRLGQALRQAKGEGRPYHVLHFDGHGAYFETPQEVSAGLRPLFLDGPQPGGHGYLLFENPLVKQNRQYVGGTALGNLLAETNVPLLALNACLSAHAGVSSGPALGGGKQKAQKYEEDPHSRVRAFGSLAQEVAAQGVAGVVGMRYSVYVATAAQFVEKLYGALAQGRPLGEAVTLGRKGLHDQPLRGGISLQDWPVPVVYDGAALSLPAASGEGAQALAADAAAPWTDPNLPKPPDAGFVGRDETLLALDRAFDTGHIVLLHAYAGSGKSAAAAEFARWYALTGGVQAVLYSKFESKFEGHLTLERVLDNIEQLFGRQMEAQRFDRQVRNPQERREMTLQVLRQAPLLWIWDNVEPVAGFPPGTPSHWTNEEQGELADFLRAAAETKARFLLTSRLDERGWLHDLPRRIPVPPMPMRERLELALALAEKRGRGQADLAHWGELLEFTQGNPLALTVLARQALRDGLRTEKQIAAFVRELREGAARFQDEASEGRSASLGAALAYGFEHAFAEEERKQLALLHLFQGVVTVTVLRVMGHEGAEWALPELSDLKQEAAVALLDRAAEAGLLEGRAPGIYDIHPALPWFLRELFAQHYAGREAEAQQAYAEAVAALGDVLHNRYEEGDRDVIAALAAEEENLLHALRLARANGWWGAVTGAMQGLRVLYDHTGRRAGWRRLVEEAAPDFVDAGTGGPRLGLEEQWGLVTQHRMRLTMETRDWAEAERLAAALVDWRRRRAAPALALPSEELDAAGRNAIRSLAASLHDLGQVQREQGLKECVDSYKESLALAERIDDRAAAAIAAFNLGHAYKNLPPLRDLGRAEEWYRRSLGLYQEEERHDRGQCLIALGHVAWERLQEALADRRPREEVLRHRNDAVGHYRKALELLPADAVNDLAVAHNGLGLVYTGAGDLDQALHHYQGSIHYFEREGNLYSAAQTRRNVALTLANARRFPDALKYAQAALGNFDSFGERAAEDIEETKGLIARIEGEPGKSLTP